MLGQRVTPEPSVTYLVSGDDTDYETPEAARQNGGSIEGVKLSYCCPYCDAPNVAVYTTPVPDGLVAECDHCEYETPLFNAVPNTTVQYEADDFENIPETIEDLRNHRLEGEREHGIDATTFQKRRERLLPLLITVGILLFSIGMLTFLIGTMMESISVALGGSFLFFALGLIGIFVAPDWYLFRGLDHDVRRLTEEAELFKRGIERQTGSVDPPMYRPTPSNTDDNDATTESTTDVVTEQE